jgi:hypothetical protein
MQPALRSMAPKPAGCQPVPSVCIQAASRYVPALLLSVHAYSSSCRVGPLTEAQTADLGTPAKALWALCKLVAVLGALPAQGAPLASATAHVACMAAHVMLMHRLSCACAHEAESSQSVAADLHARAGAMLAAKQQASDMNFSAKAASFFISAQVGLIPRGDTHRAPHRSQRIPCTCLRSQSPGQLPSLLKWRP